jgi:branched-chain amino acid transport system substrate-binding protein
MGCGSARVDKLGSRLFGGTRASCRTPYQGLDRWPKASRSARISTEAARRQVLRQYIAQKYDNPPEAYGAPASPPWTHPGFIEKVGPNRSRSSRVEDVKIETPSCKITFDDHGKNTVAVITK